MGKGAAIPFFLGVFYLRIWFVVASLNTSSIDESSLVAFKTRINSEILAKNWSQETSVCNWIGVICSRRHPRVIGLNLSNMGLQGNIAREIGNLSFLVRLDLSHNNIDGLIPGEIGNLRRLRLLDMAFNLLVDNIPQSLGLLRKLEELDLSKNYLSGDIPTSLSTCVQLKMFNTSYNHLTGNIPPGFGNLTQLQQLSLEYNKLSGEVPSAIFNISSLLNINMASNQLSGSIPSDICSQPGTKLEILVLQDNQFSGQLPTFMHCHSLKQLFLLENNFRGNIPSELWNLSAIKFVSFGRNKLTGTIPSSIANLSNMAIFDIGENDFHGTIPSEIGRLTRLTNLRLSFNDLNGELPESIFNLSALQRLQVTGNNLSGHLPLSIGEALPNIEYLYLGQNQFHGKIPCSISNLSRLTKLDLDTNLFNGNIPITLGNLRQLQVLSLGMNQLTNNMSNPGQEFLSSLATCNYLEIIDVSDTLVTGVLPKSLGSGNVSASLEVFRAESCRIVSSLPNEIGNLSRLIWLDLGYNYLTRGLPATMGGLRNLQELNISGNKLGGFISPEFCNLNNMYSLDLSENNFFGELPGCLGNLSLLREINLGSNAFNSNIPLTLFVNDGVKTINLSNNFFDGVLSRDIGNMKSLAVFDLSGNQLYGEIPSTISQLRNLIVLSLSNNRFDGSILESFANLIDLYRLDLSHNNLSGSIPLSLETLAYLDYFNVSFNGLSGEIPNGGPFANFTADFFVGNKGLCGAPRFKVEECKRSMPKSSRKKRFLKYILPPIASVVVVAVILSFVLRIIRRKKLLHPSLPDWSLGLAHERISYQEILRATNNLDEETLIGRGAFGSVYRGIFSNAMVFAVKVFELDEQGVANSFDTECQIMRSVRHRNLVKVITCCSNLDFKALLMPYMPSGNLEKWLYSSNHSSNILERLGIMIDVASALEYLHLGYTFPIVHCDLKPNNILLDEDMVAYVGDFGIAKLLTEEQRMQLSRTLGTIGYIAPEYGSEGLVSTMVDVYSYGILLMEVFSRRKPTDEMFSGELTMRRWMSESFPNSVMQIVDHELLMNMDDQSIRARHESCLTSTVELALECTADLAEARPNMKDVLVRISKINSNLSNRQSGRNRHR